MTPMMAAFIAATVDEASHHAYDPATVTDPLAQRSAVDTFTMDALRKSWPQAVLDTIPAMGIQEALNLHPHVPNLPTAQAAGSGVTVVTSQNLVTSNEMARQMEENNIKLLAAMERMITAQNANKPAPAATEK